jgi:hypothetical protein
MTQKASVGVGGVWKDVATPSVGVSGAYKALSAAYIGVSGVWQQFYSAGSSVTVSPTGVSASGSLGDVAVVFGSGAVAFAIGVNASGSVGTVVAGTVTSVSATGVSAVGSLGTVVVVSGAGRLVTTTGVSATGSIGTVTIILVPLSAVAIGGGTWSGGPGAWYANAGVFASGGTGSYTYEWHVTPGFMGLSGAYTDSVEVSTGQTIPSDAELYCTVNDGVNSVDSNSVSVSL